MSVLPWHSLVVVDILLVGRKVLSLSLTHTCSPLDSLRHTCRHASTHFMHTCKWTGACVGVWVRRIKDTRHVTHFRWRLQGGCTTVWVTNKVTKGVDRYFGLHIYLHILGYACVSLGDCRQSSAFLVHFNLWIEVNTLYASHINDRRLKNNFTKHLQATKL